MQITNNMIKLCLKVNRNNSDSFPTNPTEAAPTAIDCGEIILPVTPPEAFAATVITGSIPTEFVKGTFLSATSTSRSLAYPKNTQPVKSAHNLSAFKTTTENHSAKALKENTNLFIPGIIHDVYRDGAIESP